MNNINNHNEEEDIRGLLDGIRQQGTPYSEEPDPMYWANFRVRVMERVAEPERVGFFAKAKSWLWESGLRSSLVGGGLAALLIGGIYFGTQQDATQTGGQVAQQNQVTDGEPTPGSIDTAKEQTPGTTNVVAPEGHQPEIAQDQPVKTPEEAPKQEQPQTVDQLSEPEIAAPVLAANTELSGPATSIDDMTEQELTALLSSIEEMN